jgi:hypothetical protein
VDNVYIESMASEDGTEKNARSRNFVSVAGEDPRIEGLVMQTVGEKGWGGFMLCVVKD